MDPNTGHLKQVNPEAYQQLLEQQEEWLAKVRAMPPQYLPIPSELVPAAEKALDGQEETVIDLEGDSELARFAAQERERRKKWKSYKRFSG
jgi:hypothetical protein